MKTRLLVILGILCGVPSVRADDAVAELRGAVLRAPAVQAAQLRWEASRQRQPAEGRLPDPRAEGMYSQKSTPSEDMPMWEVTLQQPLPKAGERAAERLGAEARSAMAEAEYRLMAGETAAEAAMQLAELDTLRERQVLLEAQRARTDQALTALDARIASGQGTSAERLTLESLAADQELMVARDRQMQRAAESAVRARLGLAAGTLLPPYAAPQAGDIEIEQAPAVRLAAAVEREAAAMAAMAAAAGRPMTAVGLRFEREQAEGGDEDTIGVAFMTELPWRSRRAARADRAAARSDESAGRKQGETARLEILAQLDALQQAEALADAARDLGGRTSRRLDAETDALLRSAGTGGMNAASPVLMLVELLERQTAVRMNIIEAEGAARIARARLWRHVPPRALDETGETP